MAVEIDRPSYPLPSQELLDMAKAIKVKQHHLIAFATYEACYEYYAPFVMGRDYSGISYDQNFRSFAEYVYERYDYLLQHLLLEYLEEVKEDFKYYRFARCFRAPLIGFRGLQESRQLVHAIQQTMQQTDKRYKPSVLDIDAVAADYLALRSGTTREQARRGVTPEVARNILPMYWKDNHVKFHQSIVERSQEATPETPVLVPNVTFAYLANTILYAQGTMVYLDVASPIIMTDAERESGEVTMRDFCMFHLDLRGSGDNVIQEAAELFCSYYFTARNLGYVIDRPYFGD